MLQSDPVTNPPTPPRLPEGKGQFNSRKYSWRYLPLALLLFGLGAALVIKFQVPAPKCTLKTITGVPCPFCGSTRALANLVTFNFSQALALNPLITLATLLSPIVWVGVARSWMARKQSTFLWLAGGLLLANWAYLIMHLP